MTHLISTQSLAAIALTLGAFAATSSANARTDVYVSVGVQVPGIYMQPAPVHVQPRPVYVQPRVVYMPAPAYYGRHDFGRRHDGHQWQRRGTYGNHDRDGIANVHGWGGPRHQWRQPPIYGSYGDIDRDGVRNRWDRDFDGDGVPNRFDRLPNNPNRR